MLDHRSNVTIVYIHEQTLSKSCLVLPKDIVSVCFDVETTFKHTNGKKLGILEL